MDFARKQLEKYGWTDGKGLGKHENGMSEALKPKLKRSMTGIGHDAAADFTEHWWSALYDKAAGNIKVKEKDGRTKKIKTKDDTDFEITNSTWKLKKKHKSSTQRQEEQYQDFFVKTAVLGSGGSKVERVRDSESESDGGEEEKNVFKMTDEELFAACGGRTAHKGARHGLKALGKLARIEQQEQLLLQQSKFDGYSHAKKLKRIDDSAEKVVEDTCLNLEEQQTERKKKKKKKKHCLKLDSGIQEVKENNVDDCENLSTIKKKKRNKDSVSDMKCNNQARNASPIKEEQSDPLTKKVKKAKVKDNSDTENKISTEKQIKNTKKECNLEHEVTDTKCEKSKFKRNNVDLDSGKCDMDVDVASNGEPERKKKKRKHKGA